MLQKIKSREGATLLIALGFFLLCAVVGSVILTAGSTSSGRIAGLAEQEQSYYTVTSAARLVQEEIEGQKYYRSLSSNQTYETSVTNPPGGVLGTIIKNSTESVLTASGAGSVATFTVSVGSDSTFGEVTGDFYMGSDFSIAVTLYQTDNPDSYKCVVTVPAIYGLNHGQTIPHSVVKADGTTDEYTVTITDLTWDNGKISKAASAKTQ